MIIECNSCHARYNYDEERFERKPSKKIRCAKCQTIFEIQNPAFAPAPEPAVTTGDRTYTRRNARPAPPPQESTESAPIPGHHGGDDAVDGSLPEGKRLSLAIIDGAGAGSVFRIEKPRVTIGRAGDLKLDDGEASRVHAAVDVRGGLVFVEDLGSTNGTIVDGKKISGPTEVANQQEFIVGTTTLMLIVTEDA